MKAIFIGSKLVTTTFLSFDIQTTVGPLEVYLQNLKSLRSLPDFEAEGFGTFKICRFSERCPKEYVFDVCEVCENQKRQKNVPKEYTPDNKTAKTNLEKAQHFAKRNFGIESHLFRKSHFDRRNKFVEAHSYHFKPLDSLHDNVTDTDDNSDLVADVDPDTLIRIV